MATSSNTEKQCRAVLLLTRASAEMMRAVVMDSVSKTPGQSLDDFLKANHLNIAHHSDFRWVKDILFPKFGGTDISKWEFNVLCFVVMDVCTTHPNIANNVEDLKTFRNKLFHAPDLSDEEYSDLAEDIETKILRCCRTLNKVSLTSDVKKIIESIKKDPLSFQECKDILRSWYDSDKQISDQLKELSQRQKATQEGVEYLIKRFCPRLQPSGLQFEIIISDSNSVTESDVASILVDMTHAYIQQQQQEQQQRQQQRQQQQQEQQQEQQNQQQHSRQESDATPERKDQGTESSTEESVGQEHKEQASTEKQEHARNPKSKEPNMETVKEKFEMVLHKFCIDKTVIIKCQKSSVHLFFQCTSFDNLMKKVSECIEGRTTRLILPVQEALRQLEGYEHVCLDVVLRESWYEECIENTIKLLEERLREGLEIDDRTEDTGKARGDGNLLLTVASSSYMALLDLKNQCSSDDLRQTLVSLAEAIKSHLKIDNLSLEIKAHKAIWQDQATDMVTGGEAAGRLPSSTGSEHLIKRTCQPCLGTDNLIDATELCVDCQDYLCLKCSAVHKVQLQHHRVLDIDQLLHRHTKTKPEDECTDSCPVHKNEVIQYYCESHCHLGCRLCKQLRHASCDQVHHIPNAAKDLINNQDYKQVKSQLESVLDTFVNVFRNAQRNSEEVDKSCKNALGELRDFKRQIVEVLIEIEKELTEKAHTLRKLAEQELACIRNKYKAAHEELQSSLARIEAFQNTSQNYSSYIEMMRTKAKIKSLEDQTRQADRDISYRPSMIWFEPNLELLEILRDSGFGTVSPASTRNVLLGSDVASVGTDTGSLWSGDISVITDTGSDISHPSLRVRVKSWLKTVPNVPVSDTGSISSDSAIGTQEYSTASAKRDFPSSSSRTIFSRTIGNFVASRAVPKTRSRSAESFRHERSSRVVTGVLREFSPEFHQVFRK